MLASTLAFSQVSRAFREPGDPGNGQSWLENGAVVSQFAAVEWIDFAVAVAEGVSAAGVVGIASYLVGRIRWARQSGSEPKLEVNLARPDGTLLHVRARELTRDSKRSRRP